MEVFPSSKFKRHFKKLTEDVKRKAAARDKLFQENPFNPQLETHKLHGDKKDEWAYSIDHSFRISFIFVSGNAVVYTDIGTHNDIY